MSLEQLNKLQWPAALVLLALIGGLTLLMLQGVISGRVMAEIVGGIVLTGSGFQAGKKIVQADTQKKA